MLSVTQHSSKEQFYFCKKDGMKKFCLFLCALLFLICRVAIAQNTTDNKSLYERVSNFLKEHKDKWQDLNVPYQDGQTLHDIIVQHKYTSALEIGTSTGHSTIWI